jgi:Zn-finger nucleic acid-binding protein
MTKPVNEKPSRNEDEYFARHDAELIKELREKLDTERRTQERSAHYMKCPKCGADLEEREIESAKVDVCPECHGLWLDQGELDVLRRMSQRPSSHVMQDLFSLVHRTRRG